MQQILQDVLQVISYLYHMRSRLSLILKYWLLWIAFFEVCRIIFLLANFSATKAAGWPNTTGSLLHGLLMDASIAAYITVPVCLLMCLSLFFYFFTKPTLVTYYTAVILFCAVLITVADIGLFKAWGYRIDTTALRYLKNPAEAWASVANLPIFWIIAGIVFYWFFFFLLFKRLSRNWFHKLKIEAGKLINLSVLLLCTGAFIIPIRGGFQLAPINQSSVYFSANNYANLSAINACFNFLFSIANAENSTTNPFVFMSDADADKIVSSLKDNNSENENKSFLKNSAAPNIIIIVWESFTKKVTTINRNGIEITPCFNKLKKEGIYFSDVYASGDRTDKGIVAVLSGYPAQSISSIVKIPSKAGKLPMLPKVLREKGYHPFFYYGGEPEFANMKAYLSGGEFESFVTKKDFSRKDLNSKWGAHDGPVMEKLFSDIAKAKQPFFCNWLTLTSHEPFETPVHTVIEGDDDLSLFLNSLHYTDSVIDVLVQKCKQQPWWQNSIVVITADHGHRLPAAANKIDDFKIPVLFLGGALNVQSLEISTTASQTDIAATLLQGIGYNSRAFPFSKNILNSQNRSYAYMAYNNGFGFAQQNGYYFFDNVGKQIFEQGGITDSNFINTGKAYEQVSFKDYLSK